jgi:outer membrane protein OmpA-like peptidoglycan-associated protein
MNKKLSVMITTGATLCLPVTGQTMSETAPPSSGDTINLSYVGDATRIGVGYHSDFDLTGELLHVFSEDAASAWIGEAWISSGAGGLKLDYHWLSGEDAATQRVRKVFAALDQNEEEDRKITVGYGAEREDWSWGSYVSYGLSDEREVGRRSSSETSEITGSANGHAFVQPVTTVTTTRIFEKAYDWGVGVRVARFFEEPLVRLNGGLDYEWGDDSNADADQITLSVGLEKYFTNSPWSVALSGEFLRKDGNFEQDDDDARGMIMVRYDIGQNHASTRTVRRVPVAAEAAPVTVKKELVKTEVSLAENAFFKLDSSKLPEQTQNELRFLAGKLKEEGYVGKLRVAGHTCDLGTDAYNQKLSERRANAVASALVEFGVPKEHLLVEAFGEIQPKYPNDGEENRRRNRRVDIEYVVAREQMETKEAPAGSVAQWKEEVIEEVPAWLKRAMRNPLAHKRTVDYYRFEKASQRTETGDPLFDNTPPVAVDDNFAAAEGASAQTLEVLPNDSDADGDTLTIVAVTQPAQGSVTINGDRLVFHPVAGFMGAVTFTYTIDDGYGGQDTATVTVQSAAALPDALDDQYTIPTNASATRLDVLANDSDPSGSPLRVVEVSGAQGQVTNNGNAISYLPPVGFVGVDRFTYTVENEHGGRDTASVTVTVVEPNGAPEAVRDHVHTQIGMPVTIDVLANDSDPDGDALTVISTTEPHEGSVAINGDNTVTYTPFAQFCGIDAFRYTISDGHGNTASALVTVQQGAQCIN